MAWMMPSPPPGLVDLLRRGGVPANGAPANTMQADPQSMAVAPSGPDVLRSALTPQAPPPAAAPAVPPAQQAPPPSDDPAISQTPKVSPVPAPPDMSNSPVTGLLKNMQDTQGRITAVPKPDPSQLKPKWYDRLAGAGVGFAAGWGNPERGYDIGSNVTNRRWNSAQTQYERTVSPLQSQLQSEREQLPAAEAAAKIPQTMWQNQVKQHEEDRLTRTGDARVADLQSKSDLADQRAQNLQNQLDHPKQAQPKNADEALSAASSATDPTEKQRLIKLAGDLHKQEIDRVIKARPAKETPADKTPTPGQKSGVEATKATALAKAHSDYVKATRDLPKDPNHVWTEEEKGQLQQAKDDFDDAQQAAQSAYEAQVTAQGGSVEHQDVTKGAWRGKPESASAAQGTPAANAPDTSTKSSLVGKTFDPHNLASWKGKETKRISLEDGSKWEFKNGKPVQVSAPTKK